MVKGMHSGDTSQVANKLYHYGLIMILVKKRMEEKGVTWETFLKDFQARSEKKSSSMSISKKIKVDTSSPAEHKYEGTLV